MTPHLLLKSLPETELRAAAQEALTRPRQGLRTRQCIKIMTKRTLQRKGYKIKHTDVGWWVDGACGYMVSGYHPIEDLAIKAASQAIASAIASGDRPCWLFS